MRASRRYTLNKKWPLNGLHTKREFDNVSNMKNTLKGNTKCTVMRIQKKEKSFLGVAAFSVTQGRKPSRGGF